MRLELPSLPRIPSDIPPFNNVDLLLDEDGLRNDLNIPEDKPVADYYCHYVDCVHAVIETKGNKIGKALRQLEKTIERLISAGKKVDKAIIVLNRLSKYERRKFEIDRRSFRLYEKHGKTPRPITITYKTKKIPVFVVRRTDFGRLRARFR